MIFLSEVRIYFLLVKQSGINVAIGSHNKSKVNTSFEMARRWTAIRKMIIGKQGNLTTIIY